MSAIRVYLAIESVHYADAVTKYLLAAGPDVEIIRDASRSRQTTEVVDVLTEVVETWPDVIVHHTNDKEPSTERYRWILDEHPSLRIVHVNPDGNICKIQQRIIRRHCTKKASGASETDLLERLLEAIRDTDDGLSIDD
jgi:hypothetical protein